MRKKALVLLGVVWLIGTANAEEFNLPFKTLTQSEVAQLAREARLQLQSTDELEAPRPESPCYVAISFSMPKTSLMRLASDAARARVPLVLRGVGQKPEIPAKNDKPLTQTEIYGKGWLTRHLASIKPLSDMGASVLIDPKRFQKEQITAVPTLVCQDDEGGLHRAVGDVTLHYALTEIVKGKQNPFTQVTPLIERLGGCQ